MYLLIKFAGSVQEGRHVCLLVPVVFILSTCFCALNKLEIREDALVLRRYNIWSSGSSPENRPWLLVRAT